MTRPLAAAMAALRDLRDVRQQLAVALDNVACGGNQCRLAHV